MPKIAFIGAGSVVFTKNLLTDILSFPAFRESKIALHDIDPVRLETAALMAKAVATQLDAPAEISTSLQRDPVLEGADYVINMVQIGGHQATLLDFDIPRKYGLQQTIADTLGVGGVFRSLRTIPMLLELCADMARCCPNALLLNYTNPMAMLCWAVNSATKIRNVGLCHSVQGTSRQLATYIGADYKDVDYLVAGINHLAFFLRFHVKGEDAYPALWQALDNPEVFAKDKVRFEMFRRLGYFVTESSEHMSEYLPYFIQHGAPTIERFSIPIDEYVRRSEKNLHTFEQTRQELLKGEPLKLRPSVEYGSVIINAIEADAPAVIYGNVQNRNYITNLPAGCTVELPCLVDRNGVQPTVIGDLPPQLAAIDRTNINVQELTVAAALTGNRQHIYHAVMLDPHTSSQLPLDAIWAMCDELIAAHNLPY